ncbi:MAG: cytochrome c peroxidase [Cryomorphaceae bacterium]|jgi:cytochrome c peroxidase
MALHGLGFRLGSLCILLCLGSTLTWAEQKLRLAPGDYKQGYESADYQTDSLSLAMRKGKPAKLVAIAKGKQLGLPKLPSSKGMRPDRNKIALGRKLFYDRRLSRNKTMSCAMCHVPEQGFTSNELQRPIGSNGRSLKRNAPTILNVAFYTKLFADSRETTLEQQIWSPLLAENEMNNPSVGYVIETIKSLSDYDGLFQKAFSEQPNMLNIGQAIGQYERALLAGDSAFDRWYYAKDDSALTDQQVAGFKLFTGKAACSSCHLIGENDALFTDNLLHSTGIGYAESMLDGVILPKHANPEKGLVEVQLAPGVTANMKQSVINTVGEQKMNDVGRYEITLDPQDRWKYRTSSLRNIELTAPYMHSGGLVSLADVVAFYNQGGVTHELQSPLVRPLGLSVDEQGALRAFLRSLTGSGVGVLVLDAFDAGVGDTGGEL